MWWTRALSAARVYGPDNVSHTLDTSQFVIDAPAGEIAAPAWSLPVPGRSTAGIELDVTLGFGTSASDIPDVLRHAVRSLVAHWYENRGLIAIGQSVATLPGSVNQMKKPPSGTVQLTPLGIDSLKAASMTSRRWR